MAAAIGTYGPAAKAAVPDLLKLLDDDSGLQPDREVVAALGAIGPVGRAALPALRRLLDHGDVWVAVAARDAIARIEAPE